MARPMYPHELGDADFSWLISTFLEQRPNFIQLDSSCMPVVLLECVGTGPLRNRDVAECNEDGAEVVTGED